MIQGAHFLSIAETPEAELRAVLEDSGRRKAARQGRPKAAPDDDRPMDGRLLVMIFEKPSTRTRVSFDAAMRQLGGETTILNAGDLQLGRGETIADTARVLSGYCDAIMLRTYAQQNLTELAEHATVPVINGLSDSGHPCQLVTDVLTLEEYRGPSRGQIVAWCGDGNNMANSWIEGAARFGYRLRLACPVGLEPDPKVLRWARDNGGDVILTNDPRAAVDGADCVVTDTWVSMGDDAADRHNRLAPFQVDSALMAAARPDAIFMHCLPAHRGEEVTPEVIDGPQSVVFAQAENRVHAQKGILNWCLSTTT
ncbi:ornithine carbamoyltransferase [Minwuia thermotolerans]|uniref:Ornithine carbamoyltransferase n=1 Tax=Minwuia thermotolerans TaxID=2056226 RepID=A0A2M9FVQ1_9PROT|nr:ornithine carbamoyltransferase [Minwuia thermotolerans]PJK27555.1 ornithine carbamoyltransferase [Minwuia thermotolerans]